MLALQTATELELVAASLIPLIFLSTVTFGRWLKRHQGVKLGVSYMLFCAALSFYVPLSVFGTNLLPASTRELNAGTFAAIVRHLGAALSILGALVGIALLKRYFWELWFEKHQKTAAPKFLSQLTSLVVVITTILAVVSIAYGKDLTAFVFGSTVVVGIIGFAMQDLLGNIIAGIALELGKPFKTGDWLLVDNQRAEVVEVNWRSTRLRTRDDIYLDLPNKSIVGATITNLSFPTKTHAVRIRIGFDYGSPPNLVKDRLQNAAIRAAGVLKDPAPKVFLSDFGDSAIIYEIKFWIENEATFSETCDAVRTNVWYEAQRHGLRIPFPIRTVHIEKAKPQEHGLLETARASLLKQPLFQCLEPEQTQYLLSHARILRFGRGESLISQGDSGDSMFVLVKGQLEVFVTANGSQRRVTTIHQGDYFGEMSLLTGEPRSASVSALTDCEVWEIDKALFSEVLAGNTDLLAKLGDHLAARRLETEGALSALGPNSEVSAKRSEYRAGVLKKLYSFFEL